LLKPDGSFWMQAIISKGPKLNPADLTQQAALPLGSFLKFDPWTDQVIVLNINALTPLLSPRDKYPFEIMPLYFKLSEYKAPAPAADAPAAAPAAPAAAATPAPGDAAAAPAAATPAPAATDGATPAAAPAATDGAAPAAAPATTDPAPTTGTSTPPGAGL
jgi:hypothetical protein